MSKKPKKRKIIYSLSLLLISCVLVLVIILLREQDGVMPITTIVSRPEYSLSVEAQKTLSEKYSTPGDAYTYKLQSNNFVIYIHDLEYDSSISNTGNAVLVTESLSNYSLNGENLISRLTSHNSYKVLSNNIIIENPVFDASSIELNKSETLNIAFLDNDKLELQKNIKGKKYVGISIGLENLTSVSDRDAKFAEAVEVLKTMKIKTK